MSGTSDPYKELDTIRSFMYPLVSGISRTSQPRLFSDLLVQHNLISNGIANEINSISAYSDYEKVSKLIDVLFASIEIASNQERATKLFNALVVILYQDIELKDLAEQLVEHRGKEDASYCTPLNPESPQPPSEPGLNDVNSESPQPPSEPGLNDVHSEPPQPPSEPGSPGTLNDSGTASNASDPSALESGIDDFNVTCKCPCGSTDFKHCIQPPPDCLNGCFPEVNFLDGDNSKKAKEYLAKKLSAETDIVKTEYQRFGMAVFNFAQLLPNILKRMLKFRGQNADVLDFDAVFDRATEGADFVNYEVLNVIVEACSSACIGEAKAELQCKAEAAKSASDRYQEVFLKYAQHRVFSVCGQLQEMSSASSKGNHKELIIKIEEELKSFLIERVFHFKIAIKRILKFPDNVFLRVVLVKAGCVELTFQLYGEAPDSPLELSFDQKRALATCRISLLKYSGKVEYCCCELFEDAIAKKVVKQMYETVCQTDFEKDDINDDKLNKEGHLRDCNRLEDDMCQIAECEHCGLQAYSCFMEYHCLECTGGYSDSSSSTSTEPKKTDIDSEEVSTEPVTEVITGSNEKPLEPVVIKSAKTSSEMETHLSNVKFLNLTSIQCDDSLEWNEEPPVTTGSNKNHIEPAKLNYMNSQEPLEPVELSLLSIYGGATSHKNDKIAEHITDHISQCRSLATDLALGEGPSQCDNKVCCYFRWFYPFHYNQCRSTRPKQESDCQLCNKLRTWVQLHSKDCDIDCPITLCQSVFKKDHLTKRLTDPHIRSLGSPSYAQSTSNHIYYHPGNTYNYYQTWRSSSSVFLEVPGKSHLPENTHSGYQTPSSSSSVLPGERARSPLEYGTQSSSREGVTYTQVNGLHTGSPNPDLFREDSIPQQSDLTRDDSITSSIAFGEVFRSHPSNEFSQGPVEYEPMEKTNHPFNKNQSLQRYSVDTISRQSFSLGPNVRERIYYQSVVSNADDEEQSESTNQSSVFANTNAGVTSVSSFGSLHQSPLPASQQEQPMRNQPQHPVQRQDTHNDLNKKAEFPGKEGRNSISLSRATRQVYHKSHDMSHDSHVTVPESQDARRSPRKSRLLSAKRKQQLQSQKYVSRNSPEPIPRSSSTNQHSYDSNLQVGVESYCTTTPECNLSEDFSFPEDNEQVFSDSDTRRPPVAPLSLVREVYSPSSDSSPGLSSLEEARGTERRPKHRVLRRVDTDTGERHSKILLGSGSLTPADAKHIQDYNRVRFQDLVTLRSKKSSDESSGNRTSGVSSASVSNSSTTSAQSSGVSGVFSELDFSSMEKEQQGEGVNYETEDSASTLMGNSDQSLNSEFYLSYQGHGPLPYHDDSGLYDEPHPSYPASSYSNGSLHPLQQIPRGPPSYSQGKDFSHTEAHTSYPGLPSHTSPRSHTHNVSSQFTPDLSCGNHSYTTSYPSHTSEESGFDNEPTEVPICPYAIAHSSEESESEDEQFNFLSKTFVKDSLRTVDKVLEQHQKDIHIMRHKPRRGGKIPTHKKPGMSEENKQKLQPLTQSVVRDTDFFPVPADYQKPAPGVIVKEREVYQEALSQRLPDTPEEDEVIWKNILARRDQLKQYLMGQFYSDKVYREFVDWERKSKISGTGTEAAFFSVCDRRTKCLLIMKEQPETKKSLDEAYVCLKFASQSNPCPGIVEHYTAALLPGNHILPPQQTSCVQIFMESMPARLQELLFKCGPIPQHNVHHYACQLFDALDFLHNKQGIIHCDIKPGNILVDDTAQRIKLTNFESAEIGQQDCFNFFPVDPNVGTLYYNPPEFYRERQCSFAFDIWQAGCCVLAMCTGRRPWRHLFMDVYPCDQPDQLIKMVKKSNRDKIRQQRHGHLHPAFLEPTLKKLLYGCLHDNPSKRLTAKECSYLLNTETASTEEERKKIVNAIGYTPVRPTVLQSFSTDQPHVDVYLGSDKITDVPLGDPTNPQLSGGSVRLALSGGWMGSIECPEGMTYRQAEAEIRREFPVAEQLGPFILATYDNSPQMIWSACSGRDQVLPYRPIRPDSPVDLNSAIVLSPSSMV